MSNHFIKFNGIFDQYYLSNPVNRLTPGDSKDTVENITSLVEVEKTVQTRRHSISAYLLYLLHRCTNGAYTFILSCSLCLTVIFQMNLS